MTSGGRALFLDRDGTLIIDKDHLADPAGVELIAGTREALQRALSLGYRLFLFTNQSGIGRGLFTLADALRVNARMEEMLALPRPLFSDVCIAPEAPDQPSRYRKPSPRFIEESIVRHGLDPAQCFMVGDRPDDSRAGLNAGIAGVVVRTGKIKDAAEIPSDLASRVAVYPDVAAFVATLRA